LVLQVVHRKSVVLFFNLLYAHVLFELWGFDLVLLRREHVHNLILTTNAPETGRRRNEANCQWLCQFRLFDFNVASLDLWECTPLLLGRTITQSKHSKLNRLIRKPYRIGFCSAAAHLEGIGHVRWFGFGLHQLII
jgi:hypothetical protein